MSGNTRFFNKRDIISFISAEAPTYYRARLRDIILEEVLSGESTLEEIYTELHK